MLFPVPSARSFQLGIPYIAVIHDLEHRKQPHFPEVSAHGELFRREYLYSNCIKQALRIITDSEKDKKDVLDFYGHFNISTDDVKVLPMLPPPYVSRPTSLQNGRIRKKYNLPMRYLFYPAQFWPHKNHCKIVLALHVLKERYGIEISVVFCGSNSGGIMKKEFRRLMGLVKKLKLESQLRYLGYVDDNDIASLYSMAEALVMPTFFGASNIPPLEAFSLGCPVITSDIDGIKQHLGEENAIFVSPQDENSIAEGIQRLFCDPELRKKLVNNGYAYLSRYGKSDYGKRLYDIIAEAKEALVSKYCLVEP